MYTILLAKLKQGGLYRYESFNITHKAHIYTKM